MSRIVSEPEFNLALINLLTDDFQNFKSVTGPGRSGAVAAVYTSHLLHIPFVPFGQPAPEPVLIIDTAEQSGRTLRKAKGRYPGSHAVAVFSEPPRVRFWYEHDNDRSQARTSEGEDRQGSRRAA